MTDDKRQEDRDRAWREAMALVAKVWGVCETGAPTIDKWAKPKEDKHADR